MDNEKKKRLGGLVSPEDFDEVSVPIVAESEKKPEKEQRVNKKRKWLVCGLAAVVLGLIIFALIKLISGTNTAENREPASTVEVYGDNGFIVSSVEARFFERETCALFDKYEDYYDMAFNGGYSEEETEILAPLADLNAISIKKLKKADLVFAIFYYQSVDSAEPVKAVMRLEGLKNGPAEKEFECRLLSANRILYLSMDSLVLLDAWNTGEMTFQLMMEGKKAFEQRFTVVP